MCINIQTKRNPAFNNKPFQTAMISYPCGKCPLCLRKRLSTWIFRIEKEMERSLNSQFITLTYDNEHLPSNKSVNKRDVQLFLKRLRKNQKTRGIENHQPIRYICVSEYGTKYARPHYHLLLFNSPDHKEITKAWNQGITTSTPITPSRIRYVFKYIAKAKTGAKLGLCKEFQLTSKGIGSNYLTPQMIAYHNRQIENCYIVKKDGHTLSIPKYYKSKLYSEETALKVTDYQQKRINTSQDEQIHHLMNKFRITEEIALQKFELSKLNSTFEQAKATKF